MAKEVLSLRIDADVIARLDEVAAQIGQTRSEVAERALLVGLQEAEGFIGALDNPVLRQTMRVLSSPKLLRALANLAGEDWPDEDVERRANSLKKLTKGDRKRGEVK